MALRRGQQLRVQVDVEHLAGVQRLEVGQGKHADVPHPRGARRRSTEPKPLPLKYGVASKSSLAESRRRERLDLLPPAVPELGEAVQQDDQRSVTGST